MAKLYLIKHASPVKDPQRPSRDWPLSEIGRADATRLAELLRDSGIELVITSDEPKAMETGRILADALHVPIETGDNLHEHDRSNVPVMATREFISAVAQFFQQPDDLVLGDETANEAKDRITVAIDRAVKGHEDKTVAIVTHGTVMALYLADLLVEDPFKLWRRLGLPSYVALDAKTQAAIEVREKINP